MACLNSNATRRLAHGLGASLLAAAGLLSTTAAHAGTWVSGTHSEWPKGTRSYRVWLPTGHAPGKTMPLVVLLHGCSPTPDQYADVTRFNELADREGVVLLYPKQATTDNLLGCWNWYQTVNQKRNGGEMSIVMGMVDLVQRSYGTDPRRTYVAGSSAGGAMTANLMACHGERFAAGLIHMGGQHRAAEGFPESVPALRDGSKYDPDQRGRDAWVCGESRRQTVPMLVVHGDQDGAVNPVNGVQAARQFAQTNDLGDDGLDNHSVPPLPQTTLTMPPAVAGGYTYTVADHSNAQGQLMVRLMRISGLGHSWSGAPARTGSDPLGPDLTALTWDFFRSRSR